MAVYDFNDIMEKAAERAAGGNDYPESVRLNGNYNLEVTYAGGGTRKKDGNLKKNPGLFVIYTVLDGPLVGETAIENITLSEKSLGMFGSRLLALGITGDFLRSLGVAATEDAVNAALGSIAEALVGAVYNQTVTPNVKNDKFDNWKVEEILVDPTESTQSDGAPAVAAVPVTAAVAPVPQAAPVAPVAPTTVPGVPVGIPGGFVPQLTNG